MTVRTASQIFDEIRAIKGIKSDSKLGELLGGVRQSTVASWRKRNSIPFQLIIVFCYNNGLSLDSLILRDLMPGKPLYLPETVALMPEIDTSMRQMEPLDRYAFITELVQILKTDGVSPSGSPRREGS